MTSRRPSRSRGSANASDVPTEIPGRERPSTSKWRMRAAARSVTSRPPRHPYEGAISASTTDARVPPLAPAAPVMK